MVRDSLDVVALVLEIERQFGGELHSEVLERIKLPADVTVGTLYRALVGSDERPTSNDPEWRRLATIVARALEMPIERVTWDLNLFE